MLGTDWKRKPWRGSLYKVLLTKYFPPNLPPFTPPMYIPHVARGYVRIDVRLGGARR